MAKILLGAAVILLLGAGIYVYTQQSAQEPVENQPQANNQTSPPPAAPSPSPNPDGAPGQQEEADHVITYSDEGYSPAQVTIQQGDTVTFQNNSSRGMWPASDIHPTHQAYDGTTMQEHCQNPGATTFDSCSAVEPGAEWSFTFTQAGTWRYHDHRRATDTGTIIVEE